MVEMYCMREDTIFKNPHTHREKERERQRERDREREITHSP